MVLPPGPGVIDRTAPKSSPAPGRAPTAPTDPPGIAKTRCAGHTKAGLRCKNPAADGAAHCHVHAKAFASANANGKARSPVEAKAKAQPAPATPAARAKTFADKAAQHPLVQDLRNTSTQDVLHSMAEGLVRVSTLLESATQKAKEHAAEATRRASHAVERAREDERTKRIVETTAARAGQLAQGASEIAAEAAQRSQRIKARVEDQAQDTVARVKHAGGQAKQKATDLTHQGEEAIETALGQLDHARTELANRARAARAAGVDFYDRHREEILALILTAAKVAAVIGLRRLMAPRKADATGKATKGDGSRFRKTGAVLLAMTTEIGRLLANHPSALPLLRERFKQGNEAEQAIIGMVLGPALTADPQHAIQVIEEFLEDATSEPAADSIARRTLAPLLDENPELVSSVLRWVEATAPLVQRGALVALTRFMQDRRSRMGDVVAAAVVVLEDHDEEVRQALRWLLASASEIDLDETARAIAKRIREGTEETAKAAEALLDRMPELAQRVEQLAPDGDDAE